MKNKVLVKRNLYYNLAGMSILGVGLHYISSCYDLFEEVYIHLVEYEKYDVDEILLIGIALLVYALLWATFSSRSLRKQNREIKQLTESLHQEIKTKELIHDTIAHDLRVPFNSLIGFSDLLLTKKDYLQGEKGIEIIRSINTTSKKSYYLLEDLLAWSRIQNKSVLPRITEVDLNSLISDQIEIFDSGIEKKGISLKIDVEKDLQVAVDENMLKVIIRNLLSNAIKFTPKNGNVKIAAGKENSSMVIEVADDGIGISQQNIDRIQRTNGSFSTVGTEKEQGLGLGLTLSMEFAEKIGGAISIESKNKVGTTFKLSVPNQL